MFDLLHRLSGPRGVIRQTEFFLYSEKDREAVRVCQEKGYPFPEITAWIRAVEKDFELVKKMGIRETGILTSCSDYPIHLKLGMNRKQAMEQYLSVVKAALDAGIRPRCHFEDITRADLYGFVIPFAQALVRLSEESGIPIKVRLCDTMGYGQAAEPAAGRPGHRQGGNGGRRPLGQPPVGPDRPGRHRQAASRRSGDVRLGAEAI